ncbi:MAG: PD-(D/E)XK nuclease-like domain-containing protein [Methanobrevibacter sp.]|nr:PD-(D/E)XK nuclease-like domain-containing protein [Methanobrevibacter sp.]
MELTKENYYSLEANSEYMSASQFKDFLKCEKEALTKITGEYVEEPSKAMLIGAYVDAYFSSELDDFKKENPQIFKKDGSLLKDFEKANEIIQAIEEDKMLKRFLDGEHQVIMTGTISGVKFKIKIDSLLPTCIVDQKIMSSIKDLIWVNKDGKNVQVDFVEAYGYDIQGAIYQEIARQNLGVKLPFILAVTTKEECPDKALIQIDQYYLDQALKLVKSKCEIFDRLKKGLLEPSGCGHCPSCRKHQMVNKIYSYQDFFNKE